MPNWCWNVLSVIGRQADLDSLLAKIRRGPDGFGDTQLLLLESLVPYHPPLEVLTEAEETAGSGTVAPVSPPLAWQERAWGLTLSQG